MVTLDDLPTETLLHIQSYLPPRSVACLAGVNRRLHQVAGATAYWRSQCLLEWPFLREDPCNTWEGVFRNRYAQRRNWFSLNTRRGSWSTDLMHAHQDFVACLKLEAETRCILSGSVDSSLKLWHIEQSDAVKPTLRLQQTLHDASDSAVYSCDMTYDLLVSGHANGTLQLWDRETGAQIHREMIHSRSVNSVQAVPERHLVITGGLDKRVTGWDTRANAIAWQLVDSDWVSDLQWDDDVLFTSSFSRFSIWDVRSSFKQLQMMTGCSTTCFKWNGRGRVCTGGADNIVRLLKISPSSSPEMLGELYSHSSWVEGVCLDRDKVVSCSVDGQVQVYPLRPLSSARNASSFASGTEDVDAEVAAAADSPSISASSSPAFSARRDRMSVSSAGSATPALYNKLTRHHGLLVADAADAYPDELAQRMVGRMDMGARCHALDMCDEFLVVASGHRLCVYNFADPRYSLAACECAGDDALSEEL